MFNGEHFCLYLLVILPTKLSRCNQITVHEEQKYRTVTSSLRKVYLERRVFNREWAEQFFLSNAVTKPLCLLCNHTNISECLMWSVLVSCQENVSLHRCRFRIVYLMLWTLLLSSNRKLSKQYRCLPQYDSTREDLVLCSVKFKTLDLLSIALDESCNVKNTA